MQINKLQSLISNGIIITKHARIRLMQRNISILDVKAAILNGTIIEEYPDKKPFPACLILGNNLTDSPLYVVIASNNEYLYLITSYYPDGKRFKSDNTRRV